MKRSTWLAVVAGLALGIGCGGEEASPQATRAAETEHAEPQQEPPAAEEPPGPVAHGPGYELRATASGPYTAGQAGTFEIVLSPEGEYHVNDAYPMAVALAGPSSVTFPEASLDQQDAAELTQQRARYEVSFTPGAAGDQDVTAEVDFAVCTATSCMPEHRTLALALPVH